MARMNAHSIGWAVVAVAMTGSAARAEVELKLWTIGIDSTWNVNEFWAPWGVPNNAGGFEYHAYIDDGHIVSVDLSATVTSLSLINQAQVWIGNGKTFSLYGGTDDPDGSNVYNQGVLRIYAEGSATKIHIDEGPVTFASTEGGELVMEAGTGSGYSEIIGSGGPVAPRLINEDGHTIRGTGYLRNSVNVTNNGLITADNPAGPLVISPPWYLDGGDCTNNATLRAENGATLQLAQSSTIFVSQFLNFGGVIEALDGSTVELVGRTRIVGGELATVDTGVIRVVEDLTVLIDVTSSGALRLDPGVFVDILGTIENSGVIWVDSTAPGGGGGLRLLIDGDATLTGGGTIELGDYVNNEIRSTANGMRLTNEDNTIRGAGNIGDNILSVTNRGIIEASGATDILRINPPNLGDFTNEGSLYAMTAPGMQIDPGPFVTTGQVFVNAGSNLSRAETYQQDAGATTVNGTMSVVSGPLQLDGGALRGTGSISATVVNDGGVVEPGLSAGLLTITGTYAQGSGGAMSVELGGTSPGVTHDRLEVNGDVTLDGTLDVALINGFVPDAGDTFTIIASSGGTISGVFADVTPAGAFSITYLPDAVVLGDFGASCPGDCAAGGDGAVGVADLLALLAGWGAAGACDLDGNGIGASDLLALLAAWGSCR